MDLSSDQAPRRSGPIELAQLMVQLGRKSAVCPQHGAYETNGIRLHRQNGRPGREIWTTCPDCRVEHEEDRRQARAEEAAARLRGEIEAKLSAVAIPARFLGKTLHTYKADTAPQRAALTIAREFVQGFEEHRRRGSGLIFSGLPGTGKSHLAGAILQALVPVYFGLYTTCMEVIRMVRETWRRDSEMSERKVLDMLGSVPLLVLDEIGVQYGTEGEQTIIFDILDRRYRDMKPSILLTNQDMAGLKCFIGERAYDRLTETARWVAFDWPSYRSQARKEEVK